MCTQVVIASTTTEHVAVHIAFIQFDIGLTRLIDSGGTINHHRTTYGSNLTTSEDAGTNLTTIHRHVGNIDTTVIDITTTIETTRLIEAVATQTHFTCLVVIGFIVKLRLITGWISSSRILGVWIRSGRIYHRTLIVLHLTCIQMDIAYIAIAEREVCLTKHGTTLATTIGITLNGRNTLCEAIAVDVALMILMNTDDDVGFTIDIIRGRSGHSIVFTIHRCSCMIADITFPSATIDVTGRTTLDVGISTGGKVLGTKDVIDTTGSTGSIEVFLDNSTQQGNIRGAIGITTHRYGIYTQSTTVGIAFDDGPFVDDDVGIELSLILEQVGCFRIISQLRTGRDVGNVGSGIVNITC